MSLGYLILVCGEPTSMAESRSSRVTQLLEHDDPADRAAEQLFADVYGELRQLAANCLRHERKGHTLQPTALVHEAFLKLVDQRRVDWRGQTHFLATAAQAMRRILVDHARRRQAAKRGGKQLRVAWAEDLAEESAHDHELLAVEDALTRLSAARSAPGADGRVALLRRPERGRGGPGDGALQAVGGA